MILYDTHWGTELDIFRVISAFWGTGVPPKRKITRKSPSTATAQIRRYLLTQRKWFLWKTTNLPRFWRHVMLNWRSNFFCVYARFYDIKVSINLQRTWENLGGKLEFSVVIRDSTNNIRCGVWKKCRKFRRGCFFIVFCMIYGKTGRDWCMLSEKPLPG